MNLKKQAKFKAAIDKFNKDIRRHSVEDYRLAIEESWCPDGQEIT
jgi:hypothetical protein